MKAPKNRIRFSEWRNSDFDPKIPGPSSLSRRSIGFWVKSWGGKFWSRDVLGQSPCNVGQSKNHKLPNRWKVWLISTSFFRGRFRNLRSRPLCNGQGSGFRVSYPLGLRCKIIDRFWSMADVTKMSCFFFCFPGICFGCQNSLKHGPRQHAIASVKCVWCFIFFLCGCVLMIKCSMFIEHFVNVQLGFWILTFHLSPLLWAPELFLGTKYGWKMNEHDRIGIIRKCPPFGENVIFSSLPTRSQAEARRCETRS